MAVKMTKHKQLRNPVGSSRRWEVEVMLSQGSVVEYFPSINWGIESSQCSLVSRDLIRGHQGLDIVRNENLLL